MKKYIILVTRIREYKRAFTVSKTEKGENVTLSELLISLQRGSCPVLNKIFNNPSSFFQHERNPSSYL